MEHQWMFDGAASEATEARRAGFLDILDAVRDQAEAEGINGSTLLSWRIDAKMAQAELLQRATFARTPREKRMAEVTSQQLLTQCASLLVG
ncbi:hypothetical protein [Pseudoprimorskyibacter insulae]|nr:hypothetical protein [Pseudoprimorskyibacter insulae]